MEIILALFLYMILALLIIYPIYGLYQVVTSLFCFFEKGWKPEFYDDIKKYACIVVLYVFFGYLICTSVFFTSLPEAFYSIYFVLLPIPIAIYNYRIMKNRYPEEIEKLII